MYLQINTVPVRKTMPIRPNRKPVPLSVLSPSELRRIIAEQLG